MSNPNASTFPTRRYALASLSLPWAVVPAAPFVVMLPAFDTRERELGLSLADDLIDRGCAEFCCVGPEAELLHDSLDALVEARGALSVVTTWHVDFEDACEYFLFGASAGRASRFALIDGHPDLLVVLERQAAAE